MRLDVEVSGITFKNPIILGSAGICYDAYRMKKWIKAGFAGIVTKTTSKEPIEGLSPPRVFWYDEEREYMSGAEAWRNPGIKKMTASIKEVKEYANRENAVIIGSVGGHSPEEMAQLAAAMENAGAGAIEIDLMCPGGAGYYDKQAKMEKSGAYWGSTPELGAQVIRAVKAAVDVPVWPKFAMGNFLSKERMETLDSSKPDAFPYACLAGGIWIDTDTGKPKPYGPEGAMCIPGPVKPLTIKRTADLARLTDTQLVPSGGLRRGLDVIECFMVGASAVEICTVVYKYPDIMEKMIDEIEQYFIRLAYSSFEDIFKLSLQYLPKEPIPLATGY